MRWPVVLALSLAVNLLGWSLFGFWLGDASLHARKPELELSVVDVTPAPPAPRPPPPVAEMHTPRAETTTTVRPRPAPRRVQPQPQPRMAPKTPANTVAAKKPAVAPRQLSLTPDPKGTVPAPRATAVPHLVLRRSAARPPVRRASSTRAPVKKGADLAALRTQIRRAVNRHRHYPRLARRRGIEGKVVLAFRLSRAGGIQRVKVVRSAGRILDKAALAALRRSTPLPYYPDWVRLPVVFQLED